MALSASFKNFGVFDRLSVYQKDKRAAESTNKDTRGGVLWTPGSIQGNNLAPHWIWETQKYRTSRTEQFDQFLRVFPETGPTGQFDANEQAAEHHLKDAHEFNP